MAKTPEAKVKDRIHALLAEFHGCAVNYIGGQYANNGTSDILACVDGRFVAIEAKAGDNKPTALQVEYLARVEAAGGVALVINEQGLEYLRHCLENIHDQGLSNYRAFITPAVEAALQGGAEVDQGAREKAPRLRTKAQPRMERP